MNEPNGGAPETEELTEQQVSELIQIRRDKLTALRLRTGSLCADQI